MSAAFEGNWRRRGPPAAAGVSLDSAGWYLFCLWRQVWGGYVFVEGGRSKKPFSKLFSLVSYPFLLLLQSSCLKHFLKEKDWLLCTLAHYVQLCSAYLWDKQIQPKLPNLKNSANLPSDTKNSTGVQWLVVMPSKLWRFEWSGNLVPKSGTFMTWFSWQKAQ